MPHWIAFLESATLIFSRQVTDIAWYLTQIIPEVAHSGMLGGYEIFLDREDAENEMRRRNVPRERYRVRECEDHAQTAAVADKLKDELGIIEAAPAKPAGKALVTYVLDKVPTAATAKRPNFRWRR
jgi:hypothetical protein